MLSATEIIGITLLAAAIAAFAQYLFKTSLKSFRFDVKEIITILMQKKTFIGLVLYIVSLFIYLYALSNTPVISFVYPIFSSTFIFIMLISKFVLKEKIALPRVLGVLLVLAGIVIVSFTFPV